MLKKILIVFAFLIFFVIPTKADVMPYYVNNINTNSIGVYQAPQSIKIYKEPNENSELLLNVNWDSQSYNCTEISASNLFIVFRQKRELAFLTVIDENDDLTWTQIAYNQDGTRLGWIKIEDEFRFMNWRSFFNIYGRKYGLYFLKDAPPESKIIYGSTSKNGKQIGKITLPQTVKLTSTSGNWLLMRAFDIDKIQKIGWIKWRNISGNIFLFPAIK